jgi:hypothetical protein
MATDTPHHHRPGPARQSPATHPQPGIKGMTGPQQVPQDQLRFLGHLESMCWDRSVKHQVGLDTGPDTFVGRLSGTRAHTRGTRQSPQGERPGTDPAHDHTKLGWAGRSSGKVAHVNAAPKLTPWRRGDTGSVFKRQRQRSD